MWAPAACAIFARQGRLTKGLGISQEGRASDRDVYTHSAAGFGPIVFVLVCFAPLALIPGPGSLFLLPAFTHTYFLALGGGRNPFLADFPFLVNKGSRLGLEHFLGPFQDGCRIGVIDDAYGGHIFHHLSRAKAGRRPSRV